MSPIDQLAQIIGEQVSLKSLLKKIVEKINNGYMKKSSYRLNKYPCLAGNHYRLRNIDKQQNGKCR